MKSIALAAVLSLILAGSASALTCKADSDAKKLSGAARTSHMAKCQKDVTAACEADSVAKKLSGAAKTAHMKKCIADGVGN